MKNQILNEVESKKSIDTLVLEFAGHCEKNKFSLLHAYDYHKILESKGFPIEKKVHVFEICRAAVASKVLTKQSHFAPFMPCRIAIYENNGASVISTPNMNFMIDTLKDDVELFEATQTLYSDILDFISTLK